MVSIRLAEPGKYTKAGKFAETAMATDFTLDPRLADSTVEVDRLALCRVLLSRDANYPWLILVPQIEGLVEMTALLPDRQLRLTTEVNRAALALKSVFKPDKLNIAALGNQVAQFHVHVIARFTDDPAWPNPVWGAVPPRQYSDDELAERVEIIKQSFA